MPQGMGLILQQLGPEAKLKPVEKVIQRRLLKISHRLCGAEVPHIVIEFRELKVLNDVNYSSTAKRTKKPQKKNTSRGREALPVCLFLHQRVRIVNSRAWKHRKQCGCCGSGAGTKLSEDVVPWEAIRYLPLHRSRSDRPPDKFPWGKSEVEDIKEVLTEAASTLVRVVCQADSNTVFKRNSIYATSKIFKRRPRQYFVHVCVCVCNWRSSDLCLGNILTSDWIKWFHTQPCC